MALTRGGREYLTFRKVMNFLKCEAERFGRRPWPRAKPYTAILDPTNICRLRCSYCPTGRRRPGARPPGFMGMDLVRGLLDDLGPYLISANLFNWGEPLLHPRIADIAAEFHKAGVFTQISTNLNIDDEALLEDLCKSGLDYLMISLSGATQEVYREYHQGGDLALVEANTRRLQGIKRRLGLKKPVLEWKFLVFKHNRHQIRQAGARAAELGVDVFRYRPGGGERESLVRLANVPLMKGAWPCRHLWGTVLMNPDGSVAPCCYLFFPEDDFGVFPDDSLEEIRQNRRSLEARLLFSRKGSRHLDPRLSHPCLKCELVHRQSGLRDYLRANPWAEQRHRTGGA